MRGIAELAAAFVPSRERQLETTSQGRAFIDISRAAWDADGLDAMVAACRTAWSIPSPSAWSPRRTACRWRRRCTPSCMRWSRTGFPRRSRLIPLGQTDSQRVLVKLEAAVAATANRALNATLDDLGSATFRADLASLRHETQYTRLFVVIGTCRPGEGRDP